MADASLPHARRLYSLDAARAIAALAVVFQHWEHFASVPAFAAPHDASPLYALFQPLYDKGARAVTFFFCLSGFIFFWLYGDKVRDRKTGPATFAVLRLSRLYPLHLATLLAVLILQIPMIGLLGQPFIYQQHDAQHFALNLFLIQYWGFEQGYSFNGPSWSISVEIFLYLAFFLACRWLRPSFLICAILTIVGLALARFSILASASASFFIGGCAIFAYRVLLARWSSLKSIALVASAAALWITLPVATAPQALASLPDNIAGRAIAWFASHVFELVLFPATILALALTESVWRSIPWRWLHDLGNMSFGIYLLHFPLQLVFVLVAAQFGMGQNTFTQPLTLAIFFAVLLLLAATSYRWFEKPAMDAIRDVWKRRRDPQPVQTPTPASTQHGQSAPAP